MGHINNVFAYIFLLEAIIKIIGFGRRYFMDNWNVFDFVIVIGSIVGIILERFTDIKVGASTTVIRAFKIGRMFKLVRRFNSIKIIFQTLLITLPAIANVSSLLILLLFIYSILGVELFSEVKHESPLHDNANFKDFGHAFITLIRISTGENWHELLDAVSRQNSILFQCLEDPTY
jgi:hypothetical protein